MIKQIGTFIQESKKETFWIKEVCNQKRIDMDDFVIFISWIDILMLIVICTLPSRLYYKMIIS